MSWEFHRWILCILGISILPPDVPELAPTHPPSNFKSFCCCCFILDFFVCLLFSNPLHPISVPACAWEWGHPLMYRQPSRGLKNDSSFPISHQLWLGPPWGVRSQVPAPAPSMPEHQATWSCAGLGQVNRTAVSSWVRWLCHIQTTESQPSPTTSDSCTSSVTTPLVSLSLGERCDKDVPVMAEHPTATSYLHADHFWVSIFIASHHKEKLLWWGLKFALEK